MKELEHKNQKVMSILDKVLGFFENLTFENFDYVFPAIVDSMKTVHSLRNEMILAYDTESLLVFEDEAFYKAKLIEEKFDNIVTVFRKEEKRLERELSTMNTKKKLTVYKR